MKKLNKLILGAILLSTFTVQADAPRQARYHAECSKPIGVFDEDIYDYSEYSYGSYKITPLVGKKILFTNSFCVFTEY
ncbi:hypothetical protein pEaSNUABM49_00433 [Erwinia phage pEa_SNUABM_49]|nr:hypothetical protein pEaSNUABM49_00433 [Erwinia phage pEa_SNUABM_49]